MVVRGEGVYLYDSTGKQYLDGSGGAAISCLGHGHEFVINAINRQIGKLAFAHTMFFTNRPQEELAEKLVARFGQDDAQVYFLSGGSEASAEVKILGVFGQVSSHYPVSVKITGPANGDVGFVRGAIVPPLV